MTKIVSAHHGFVQSTEKRRPVYGSESLTGCARTRLWNIDGLEISLYLIAKYDNRTPMSFQLNRSETVEEAMRRIALEQLDDAVASTKRPADEQEEAVHTIRRSCKRLRGLLRLVQGSFSEYRVQNAIIRDGADLLSSARDSAVLLRTNALVMSALKDSPGEQRSAEALAAAQSYATSFEPLAAAELTAVLEIVRERLLGVRNAVPGWTLEETGFDAFRYGLEATHRRAQRAMKKAMTSLSPALFHEWRKRVKYHGHHMRLLREVWPSALSARESTADHLADLLGKMHDLHVYRTTLTLAPPAAGADVWTPALSQVAERLETGLIAQCTGSGEELFGSSADELIRGIKTRWKHAGFAQ
ncbi:MAG: CHAD domain-containing protein [Gammaproteobacteria bacterium]|nr:CHAD domain-containing protein [Gammaproteobacteria bacterium]